MKSVPSSYFSIVGISWPIVDNLLFHYASHHNVLEKMVMFESEKAAQEMRAKIKSKERTIESLAKELEDMKKSGSSSKDGRKELTVKEEIQGKLSLMQLRCLQQFLFRLIYVSCFLLGAREMRVLMEQLKEEIEN